VEEQRADDGREYGALSDFAVDGMYNKNNQI
jgi:hypothetical protein